MGATRLWVRIELRRRWRRNTALALMVALVATFALTCVAGARRTTTAYDRFAAAQLLPDLELVTGLDHPTVQSLRDLPGVIAAGSYVPFFAAPTGRNLLPGQDFEVFAAADQSYNRSVDRPLVTAGRMPLADRADEVLVAKATAQKLGLHLGDQLTLDSLTPAQFEAINNGGPTEGLTLDGPHPTVRVVGIGRTRLDIGVNYAVAYLVATPAFYDRYATSMANYGEVLDIRLAGGVAAADAYAEAARSRLGDKGPELTPGRPREQFQSIRDAGNVQAVALLLVALVGLLAGGVALSQAIGRSLASDAGDHRTLAMLGQDRRGRVTITVATFAPAVLVGAALAVAGSWLASSRFPSGPTGRFEVDPGVSLDAVILLPGAAALGALVLLRAAWGARRLPGHDVNALTAPRSTVLDPLVRVLRPPEAIGLRWALPNRDVAVRASARAALVGVIIGVTGLGAALSYGSSLDKLVSTPAAYGWPFVDAGGGDDPAAVADLLKSVAADPAVGDVATVHIVASLLVDGQSLQALAFEPSRGAFAITIVHGRPPAGPDEIALGTSSARDLKARIGGTVTVPTTTGPASLKVVGVGLFPNIEKDDFATGAMLTPAGLAQVTHPDGYDDVLFRWAPGTDVPAAITRLHDTAQISAVPTLPPDLASLALLTSYPALLSAFVAALALLAVLHSLTVSVRGRRRQLGTLRALGFTRAQGVRTVVAQGVALVAAGLVVGLPLGIALGRTAWRAHADRLGVAAETHSPLLTLLLLGGGGVLVVITLALGVGGRALRPRPAEILRDQ